MAHRPWILEVVAYFIKKLYSYWGNLEEIEQEERLDDLYMRIMEGLYSGGSLSKSFRFSFFRNLFRRYYNNWQFDEAIVVFIADSMYDTLIRLRRLSSDFIDQSDMGLREVVKPADLPYILALPVTPGQISSRPWLLGDPRIFNYQDEIHERSGRPPKTGTSHKNAIFIE